MSKEIIIDGVNIAECGFLCCKHNGNELIKNYCSIFNNKCICNPDCYFKQLQRLKQEKEELKKRCEELDKMTGIFSARLANKYKQALEEIRKILEVYSDDDWKATREIEKIISEVNK